LDPRIVDEGNSWEDEEQPARSQIDGAPRSSLNATTSILQAPRHPVERNSGELPFLVEATMVHEDDSWDEEPIQLVEAKPFTVWVLLRQRNG
jgi:hypothetical protein